MPAGFVAADSGDVRMIVRKSPAELEKMRRSGLLVHEILQKLAGDGPGRRFDLDLEVVAERMIREAGARPAFKGYYTAVCRIEVSICAVHVGER